MQIILVKSGSPAEKAGLRIKDLIVEINGTKIQNINDYRSAVGLEKGWKIIKYVRGVVRNDGNNNSSIYETRVLFE